MLQPTVEQLAQLALEWVRIQMGCQLYTITPSCTDRYSTRFASSKKCYFNFSSENIVECFFANDREEMKLFSEDIIVEKDLMNVRETLPASTERCN